MEVIIGPHSTQLAHSTCGLRFLEVALEINVLLLHSSHTWCLLVQLACVLKIARNVQNGLETEFLALFVSLFVFII